MGGRGQESVEVILTRAAGRWRSVATETARVAAELQQTIGSGAYLTLVAHLEESIEEFSRAVTRFEEAARRPEVVVATTGTTSSGKSTLANLLIGEALLPKAVQEMSAGVVAVHHDEHLRKLVVEQTRGATWPTGTWEAVSADEVQARLESTMQAYRDLLGADAITARSDLDPPRFLIHWPTRMGRRPTDFGLPAGARLRIVDLPGVKFVDDDINGGVVREQARRALCLVAYNSFETDPRKQESLLRQVVDQVKALSGSPARMLFVLNRIDAFRTDRDPVASERTFTDRVTRQIRAGIREALPEYTEEVMAIEPIPLSSEPALYAVLADATGQTDSNAVFRKLTKEYAILFPDEEMDRLPRSPTGWSEQQRRWFINEAKHQSHLDAFEQRLGAHISKHLPELLLPELVDGAAHAARVAVERLDALVTTYSLMERKQVEAVKERLEAVHQRLRGLQKEALHPLNPLRGVAGGDGDLVEKLLGAVPKVEATLGLAGPEGSPGRLSALQSALPDAVQHPLQRLNDYVFRLMGGEDLEEGFIQSAASADKLHAALAGLRATPYGRVWKTGGDFEAAEAEQVMGALSAFAAEMASVATSLVTRESRVQAERMKLALDTCGEVIVTRLEDAAQAALNNEFQGLRGVFRGTFALQPPRLPRVRFATDVKSWSHVEERTVQESYWVKERVWWKLWLGKSDVKKTRSVVRKTTREGITVTKLGDLLEGFISSGGVREIEEFFARWLEDSIAGFEKTLEQRLKEGVKTYRRALEQRLDEIERGAQTRIENAEKHRAALHELAQSVDRSRQWRGLTDV